MKKLFLVSFIFLCFLSLNAQTKKGNPYHTSGTKEYQGVTAKLLGEWDISSFTKGKAERIGTDFDKATVDIKEFNEREDGGVAVFRFTIPRAIIDERIASWNKKETTITVDSYVIVSTVEYKIDKSGDIIYFEKQINTPVITGSGDQLENFQQKEISFITSQSSMKNEGGASNLLGAKILKSVSGTEFIPNIPGQVNYKNITDNSVDFVTISKTNFKLTR